MHVGRKCVRFVGAEDQVKVIGHQAIAGDLHWIPLPPFREKIEKPLVIPMILKDRPAIVTSVDHVKAMARDDNSRAL